MKSFAEKLSFTSEWFCLSPRLETIAASQCFLELCRSQGLPRIEELLRVGTCPTRHPGAGQPKWPGKTQASAWECGMGTGWGWAGLWGAGMGTWTMDRVWVALKVLCRVSQDCWCPQCPDSIQDSCSFSNCTAQRLLILAAWIPLRGTYVQKDLDPCSFRCSILHVSISHCPNLVI